MVSTMSSPREDVQPDCAFGADDRLTIEQTFGYPSWKLAGSIQGTEAGLCQNLAVRAFSYRV